MPITDISESFTVDYTQYKRQNIGYSNPLSGSPDRPVRVVIRKDHVESGDLYAPTVGDQASQTYRTSWEVIGEVADVNPVLNALTWIPTVNIPGTDQGMENVIYFEAHTVTGTFSPGDSLGALGSRRDRRAELFDLPANTPGSGFRVSKWEPDNNVLYLMGDMSSASGTPINLYADLNFPNGSGTVGLIKYQATAGTYFLTVECYYDDIYKTTPDETATITLAGTEFNDPPEFTEEPPTSIDATANFIPQLGEVDDPVDRILDVRVAMKYHPLDPFKSPNDPNIYITSPNYGSFERVKIGNRVSGTVVEEDARWWRFIGTIDECNAALRSLRYVSAGTAQSQLSVFFEVRVSDGANVRIRGAGRPTL